MGIDQRTAELEEQFASIGAAIAREKLQRRDPQYNPALMERCMGLAKTYAVELNNGHAGNRRMLMRQEMLEQMMGMGDYYHIEDGLLNAARYGT